VSAATPPRHLPFAALKVCAARLLALPVFGPVGETIDIAPLLRRFSGNVEGLKGEPEPRAPLSKYLNDQIPRAEKYIADELTPEQAKLQPLLAPLRDAVAGFTCKGCAGGGHQCDGKDHRRDDARIADTGLCLSLIREMHEQLSTRMREVIAQWGWADNGHPSPAFEHQWGTDWSDSGPEGVPRVGATTDFRDGSASERFAEIRLELQVNDLNWSSLLQIPWLFTHELVCHVFQAPPSDGGPRPACRPACSFYEGWMDEVARRLLRANLVQGSLGPIGSGFVRRRAQDIDDSATSYRRWRRSDKPRLARQWIQGANAAESAAELFELGVPTADLREARHAALRQLVALSYRIQNASRSVSDLDKAVEACLLACRKALSKPAIRPQALALLSRPMGDIGRWINKLNNI
jgi:hypothetical protein